MIRPEVRPTVKPRSTTGTGVTCVTSKNRGNDLDRPVSRRVDPVVCRHVEFRDRAVMVLAALPYPRPPKGLQLRELAHVGYLPATRKSSW